MDTPLFIRDGQTIDDLLTIADCDSALFYLTDAIVSIQNADAKTPAANKAIRFRRLALQRVQEKRAQLKRQADDDRLVAVIERSHPAIVAEARRLAF